MRDSDDGGRSTASAGAEYAAVKPLEWRDHSFDGSTLWIARTPFDDYRITKEDAEWPYVVRPFRTPQSNYQTIEEAKADCEADYEQRIRAAIAALPAPAVESVTVEELQSFIVGNMKSWMNESDFVSTLLSTFTITRKNSEPRS